MVLISLMTRDAELFPYGILIWTDSLVKCCSVFLPIFKVSIGRCRALAAPDSGEAVGESDMNDVHSFVERFSVIIF